MSDVSALVARARGLAGHLLRPEQMAQLCGFATSQLTTQFASQLAAWGALDAGDAPARDARALELALRRQVAGRLRVLARWTRSSGALSLLFDEEDTRSLRALVRAIVSGVQPERRTEGLLATPTLPMRALNQLASCGDVANLASLLVAWNNPFGAALAMEASRPRPELFRYDLALARVFAQRSHGEAGRDHMMRHFAARIIDLSNLWSTLVLCDHHADVDAAALFLPGGELLTVEDIAFAIRSAHRETVIRRLAPRLAGSPLAAALDADGGRDAEERALDALATEFAGMSRREPTGTAPVIAFVLRQRAELRSLVRILWSVSVGIPPTMMRRSLGVAA